MAPPSLITFWIWGSVRTAMRVASDSFAGGGFKLNDSQFVSNLQLFPQFFDDNGSIKQEMINALHDDITVLLFPSKERALALNKGYKIIVEEQSYIYGRDTHIKPMKNVYKVIKEGQVTGITKPIVRP